MNKKISKSYPEIPSKDINGKKYFIFLLSKWYWLLIPLTVAMSLVYLFNDSVPNRYELNYLIMYKEESERRSRSDNAVESLEILRNINQFDLESNMELLKSHQLLNKTLEKLDFEISYHKEGRFYDQEIYRSAPFRVVHEQSPALYTHPVYIELLSAKRYKLTIDRPELFVEYEVDFGKQFSKHGLNLKLIKNEHTPEALVEENRFYFIAHNMTNLIRSYQEKLEVLPVEEESNILKLSVTGHVPEKENKFLTTLVETYKNHQLEKINENADKSIQFINHQMSTIEKRLLQYENELQNLRMNNKQIGSGNINQEYTDYGEGQGQSGSLYNQINELENQKMSLQENKDQFRYLADLIKNNQNLDSVILPMNSEIESAGIRQLMDEITDTQEEIDAASQNVQSNHPHYQSLKETYKKQKQSLYTRVNSYINYIDKSIARLEERINDLESQIPSYPRRERRYQESQRKIAQNENILNNLSEKKLEFEMIKASNTNNFEILKASRPEQANLVYPNKKINYLFGFFIGFILPAGLLIMRKNSFEKIEEKNEISENTSIPILHALEDNPFKTNLPVLHYPQSHIADAFRSIRTKIRYKLKSYDSKVIMISSMVSGEGKSFVTANLGAIMAMGEMKTIIVSADIRKPTLHKIFPVTNKMGLSNYLTNHFNYEDLIQPTPVDNLYFLPAGKSGSNAGDLFSESKINALLDYLSTRFEYILFDSPPFSMVPESMIISEQSHCNVFLLRHMYSPKKIIESLNEIYDEGKLNNMFLLVNSVKKMKGAGFEYYFGYDSAYGFGYYNHYYNNKETSMKIPEGEKLKR
ncbi:MAG: polysaccharide biosynthesis tyrosine autokinase [Bacteroidales bacterium]|nr:polysaccharide biosynthesis tyrosine autokinase [Bacteroidales bacterium]